MFHSTINQPEPGRRSSEDRLVEVLEEHRPGGSVDEVVAKPDSEHVLPLLELARHLDRGHDHAGLPALESVHHVDAGELLEDRIVPPVPQQVEERSDRISGELDP